MTLHRLFPRFGLLLLLPALLLVTGCDREDDDHDDHFLSVDRVEVRDRDTDDLYAIWMSGMDMFDEESMPLVQVDESIPLNIHFFDFQNNEPDLGGEYLLDAWINSGAATEIIELDVRDDHVIVRGLNVGTTQIVFDLSHGNHSDYTSVPLTVSVGNVPVPGNPNVP